MPKKSAPAPKKPVAQKMKNKQTPRSNNQSSSNLPAPIANPCGIPFKQQKIPEEAALKGLQIRAELNKLGEPSRAYSIHLANMCSNQPPNVFGDTGRILLSSRFAQIEGAKPASSPYVTRN